MKKVIGLVLIFLLLSVTVNQAKLNQREILYVDDDNTLGPWDGSIDYPFDTIQKAVDNASTGDTIFVKNGRYNGNIIIETSVNLIGEDKFSVQIIGGKHDIWILADDVLVSNFTIVNSSRYFSGVYVSASGCKVKDNIVKNNYAGVYIDGGSSNTVKDNVFLYNDDRSVRIEFSNENLITGNYIGFCGDGIYCWSSSLNQIKDNTVDNCLRGMIMGDSCENNRIYQNNLFRNYYFNGDDFSSDNIWDDGEQYGNFWDDYKGMDDDNDGIGDSSYVLPTNGVDRYPLINPYNRSKPLISISGGLGVTVQIENKGDQELTTLMQLIISKKDFSLKDDMYEIYDLKTDESMSFNGRFFGIGIIDIEVILGSWHWYQQGLLLGPFVLIQSL